MEGHHGKKRLYAKAGPDTAGQEDSEDEILRLIDSESNEYVLVRPHEGLEQMELQEDKELISDIAKVSACEWQPACIESSVFSVYPMRRRSMKSQILIVAAVIGGLLAGLLGQPVISGYLMAGSIVGPGGLGVIQELVQ
eukprot:scaffold479934_cov47-Prasinocladus_malaysianus.AAC.1